ncbi:MAG: DNA replication/repair protein RecF [Christensenellales bacterium]
MQITRIRLKNFRNYAALDIRLAPGLTVFYGANAQGKTNILESIYLCCTGRSHRTVKDGDLVRWDSAGAYVGIDFQREGVARVIEMTIQPDKAKKVRLDGKIIPRIGQMMGQLNAVLFSPEDLKLVKEGPGMRRRFLDMELSQLYPTYFYHLQQYHRALKQRNALLREGRAHPRALEQLPAWDEQLVASLLPVVATRKRFVAELSGHAADIHRQLTGGGERLEVSYQASLDAADAQAAAQALKGSLKEDLRRATTCLGPHRDDFAISANGVPLRAYGSQGQQRTAALSLRLSELTLMQTHMGQAPILLLDDVMSELDVERQNLLLRFVMGQQAVVTCTDLTQLPEGLKSRMRAVEVSRGTVADPGSMR